MIKVDEHLIPDSCFNRAAWDEPIFVLLGRDASAPAAIRAWIVSRILLSKNQFGDPQTVEAEAIASEMEAYLVRPR
jgi:hypothetical protein